jgi:secreted trypsin-like serine protease
MNRPDDGGNLVDALVRGVTTFFLATTLALPAIGAPPLVPNADRPFSSEDWKAVGGRNAKAPDVPWAAAIFDDNVPISRGPVCGGTFVSAKVVLTAAHCVVDDTRCNDPPRVGSLRVMYGGTDLRLPMRSVGVRDVHFPTARYGCGGNRVNDIALLELQEIVSVASYMQLVSAQRDAQQPGGGHSHLSVVGWGVSRTGGVLNQVLQEVADVPLVPLEACNGPSLLNGKAPPGILCAGQPGKAACKGDSGGPLFFRGPGGAVEQHGIVSQGSGCGERDKPTIYTRVGPHQGWIAATAYKVSCAVPLGAKAVC